MFVVFGDNCDSLSARRLTVTILWSHLLPRHLKEGMDGKRATKQRLESVATHGMVIHQGQQ